MNDDTYRGRGRWVVVDVDRESVGFWRRISAVHYRMDDLEDRARSAA